MGHAEEDGGYSDTCRRRCPTTTEADQARSCIVVVDESSSSSPAWISHLNRFSISWWQQHNTNRSNHSCHHQQRHRQRRHLVQRSSWSEQHPSQQQQQRRHPCPLRLVVPPHHPLHQQQHLLLRRQHPSSGHHQHHHHHHHHHYCFCCFLPTNFVFFFFCLLPFLSCVMASPVRPTASPKWINPCNYDLDSRSSSASSETVDFQSAEARDMYDQIMHEVGDSKDYVQELKLKFVEETFGDPSFTEEFQWISYDWLPKIPAATPEHFATPEVSLKNSFEYLQHFAVAIEQMTMDQMIYEGSHLDQFRVVEKKLRNVLCLLQGAMLKLHVEANPDVTRGVMSEEYRSIESDAMRNVRDYIILRDHAHALGYIHKAFSHFQDQDAPQ